MIKRKDTYLMKKMKERVGIERDPSGRVRGLLMEVI